jgi:PIN domain nuclease of toxin-antitoxin system
MKYLLDTHILLWSLHEPSKLNRKTQDVISNTNNIIFVSTSTLWELQIKKSIGKISLPNNFSLLLEQGGYELLDMKVEHINKLNELPLIHKDPFDRMLIAQSICENIPLITNDREIMKYETEGFKYIVS